MKERAVAEKLTRIKETKVNKSTLGKSLIKFIRLHMHGCNTYVLIAIMKFFTTFCFMREVIRSVLPPCLAHGQGMDSESLQITGTSSVWPHNGTIIFILFLWEMCFCIPSGKNPNGFKSHVCKMALPIFNFKWEAMASANTAWCNMSYIMKKKLARYYDGIGIHSLACKCARIWRANLALQTFWFT